MAGPWEQAGRRRKPRLLGPAARTGCTERPATAPNGTRRRVAAPTPACGSTLSQVRVGAASCFTAECSALLRSGRPGSIPPGKGVCAGQGAKEPLVGVALHLGADWVQVGEEVSVPEVLTDAGEQREALTCGDGDRAVRRGLPVDAEVVWARCSQHCSCTPVADRPRDRSAVHRCPGAHFRRAGPVAGPVS